MSSEITAEEGSSVLFFVSIAVMFSWLHVRVIADRKGWSRLGRTMALSTAVIATFPAAFFISALLMALGSWVSVLAGAAVTIYRFPGGPQFVADLWARAQQRNRSTHAEFDKPEKLSATAWTVKRDKTGDEAGAARQSRYIGNLRSDECPVEVSFRYRDVDGNVTKRRVTATWMGEYKFDAHCHLRNAERSFIYERILGHVIDENSGEIMSASDWKDRLIT